MPARAWTLEVLAARAGMSRARFAVHFVRVVGQPAGEYLMAWRIGIAQQLLLRGRPVKVVAGEVGYGTPGALTRAFTQQLGMTPSAWLAERSRATTAVPP
jgi:AraC-like DNA-binding protein